jgi:hypothetical protein
MQQQHKQQKQLLLATQWKHAGYRFPVCTLLVFCSCSCFSAAAPFSLTQTQPTTHPGRTTMSQYVFESFKVTQARVMLTCHWRSLIMLPTNADGCIVGSRAQPLLGQLQGIFNSVT